MTEQNQANWLPRQHTEAEPAAQLPAAFAVVQSEEVTR